MGNKMYTGSGIIKIFAGRTGKPFAQRMCNYLGAQMGDATTIMFDEGNIFVRINESIRDKDVYIVQPIGREPNDEFTELLFWIDAFKRSSANSVTAIIPYFSYAKGDKKDEPRVSIRARVCADCIEAAGVDRLGDGAAARQQLEDADAADVALEAAVAADGAQDALRARGAGDGLLGGEDGRVAERQHPRAARAGAADEPQAAIRPQSRQIASRMARVRFIDFPPNYIFYFRA